MNADINGHKLVTLAQELNPKIPSYNGHALIYDVTDIKVFAGLQSDNDAVVKVTHSYFGAEIVDLYFHCDLRDGNSINTKTEWRSGLVADLQNALTRSTKYLGFMDSSKIFDEIEEVLDSSQNSLLYVSAEIIKLTNLRYESLLDPITMLCQFIKTSIRNQSELFIQVVEYYLVKLEYAVSFR